MFDKYYNYGMAIPKIAPEHKVMLTVEEACGVFGIKPFAILTTKRELLKFRF